MCKAEKIWIFFFFELECSLILSRPNFLRIILETSVQLRCVNLHRIFFTLTSNTRTCGSSVWNILHVNVQLANDINDKISTSIRVLCILYITLTARNSSKHEYGPYRPKQKFSHIFIVVFLTEFTSPYSLNTQREFHTSN